MLQKILFIAIAGAAGALSRYWLGGFISRALPSSFPFGTFAVNIIGCLFFGLFWSIFENHISLPSQLRMMVFVGFFGSFTTFSTFVFESNQLLAQSQWLWAAGNILLQNILGIIAMFGGLAIGKYI